MIKKRVMRIGTMCIVAFAFPALLFAETVGLFFDSKVPQISFAAGDVKIALESKGFKVEMLPVTSLRSGYANKKVVITLASNAEVTKLFVSEGGTMPAGQGNKLTL